MNSSCARPAWMISRAIALARAMSEPTSRPSHRSAHSALDVRRGIDRDQPRAARAPPSGGGGRRSDASPGRCCPTGGRGPSPRPHDMSWFRHQRRTRSPDRRQRGRVRCGCSCRCCCCPGRSGTNFWAAKLTSLVDLLQLKIPKVLGPCASPAALKPGGDPVQRLVPGRGTEDTGRAVAVADERRGEADVRLRHSRTSCVEGPTRRV